jgi:hypothetical protein
LDLLDLVAVGEGVIGDGGEFGDAQVGWWLAGVGGMTANSPRRTAANRFVE